MRLLLISNLFPPHVVGGYELACYDISLLLQSAGHEVAIATSMILDHRDARPELSNALQVHRIFRPVYHYEGLIAHEIPLGGVAAHLRSVAFSGVDMGNAQALATLLQSWRPDQVWIFNPLGLGPVGIMETALTFGCPVISVLADDLDGVVSDCAHREAWLPRWAALKRHVTAISCSEKTRCSNETFGRYAHHAVIPLPVKFPPARTSVVNDHLRFVYFGQIARHKGITETLTAFARFYSTISSKGVTLDLIGSGTSTFLNEVRTTIQDLGLLDMVKLCGSMSRGDLYDCLPDYDVALLLMPESEAFGLVAVEAVALGVAPVLTARAGVSELFPLDYPLLVRDRADVEEVVQRMVWSAEHHADLRALADRTSTLLRESVEPTKVIAALLREAQGARPPNVSFTMDELVSVATLVELRQIL